MAEMFGSLVGLVGSTDRTGKPGEIFKSGMQGLTDAEMTDRRAAVRFPIEQEVRYKVFNRNTIEMGAGRTINMSSNGVLFTTERALSPGERLEVAVNWPAQLDNRCALKLVTTGRVIRSEGDRAAIAIERYEFRTQGIGRMF